MPRLTAQPAGELEDVEPLLEDLPGAEAARERLAELADASAEEWGSVDAWAARVLLDEVPLVVRGRGETWEISAPAGTDSGVGMQTARRLHGLLGAVAEGWDDDR